MRIHCSNNMLHTSSIDEEGIEGYRGRYEKPISIISENTSAIKISMNPYTHSNTKYSPMKYKFLR